MVTIEAVPTISTIGSAYINSGITLGTVILFAISLLGVIIAKIKLNKDDKNEKIKKLKNVFKILLIISIAVFVIWRIIYQFRGVIL